MPRARIVINVEVDATDVDSLVAELRLTHNPERPGNAAGAADKLERAGVAPIAFDDGRRWRCSRPSRTSARPARSGPER